MLFCVQLVKYNLLLIYTQVTCCEAQFSHAYLLVNCIVIYRLPSVLMLVEYIYFSTFKTCRALLIWCYSVSVTISECRPAIVIAFILFVTHTVIIYFKTL